MFPIHNYGAQLKELQEKYQKEYNNLMQGARQQHNQEMQALQQARMNPGQQTNQQDATTNVVPPHVQQLAVLGDIKALMTEIRDFMKPVDAKPEEQAKTEVKEVQSEKTKKKDESNKN